MLCLYCAFSHVCHHCRYELHFRVRWKRDGPGIPLLLGQSQHPPQIVVKEPDCCIPLGGRLLLLLLDRMLCEDLMLVYPV